VNDLEALERCARLERMGLIVKSAKLAETAEKLHTFRAAGGNRAMRRAAARATRKRGR
jgi:hypothetical protein